MMLLESWQGDLVQRLTQPNDPGTVALTGEPASILLLAAILALPVSLALLRRYRRAVLRSMRARADQQTAKSVPPENPTSPSRPTDAAPDLPTLSHASPTTARPETNALYSRLLRLPWRAAAIYAIAGSCYALIMAAASLVPIGFLPVRFLVNFWCYAWPVVLMVALVAAATRRAKLATAAVYFFVLLTLGAIAKIPPLEWGQIALPWWVQIVVLWLTINLPATVLLWLFLNRRVRAVGPLVLTFTVIALTGSDLALTIARSDERLLRSIASLGLTLGVGAVGMFIALIVLGFGLFGVVGWLALRWIGARYEHKKLSDQSVTLDSIWLLFGIVQSIPLVFGGAAWILSGFVAFAAYKIVARVGFSVLGPEPISTENSTKLLLLRVFSLGRRSEQLFDALAKHWRHVGSIRLIAGPDLATTTIEPHEFLEFLTGKLARRFIDEPRTLDLRISEMDLQPDWDGRFRVNDFFCYDDTWQMVLSRIEGDSDAVLMDLRGFSQQNRGVVYEIEELINVVPLERVVFVVDETTDEELLRQTVQECWDRMRPTSPNRSSTPGELNILRFRGSRGGSLRQLLRALCAAAKLPVPVDKGKPASV
jgi:hypothetical protein